MSEDKSKIPDSGAFYLTEIKPLMQSVLDLCEAHNIPMMCAFQVDANGALVTSHIHVDGEAKIIEVMTMMAVHSDRVIIDQVGEAPPGMHGFDLQKKPTQSN
jgi:hypothetical protein